MPLLQPKDRISDPARDVAGYESGPGLSLQSFKLATRSPNLLTRQHEPTTTSESFNVLLLLFYMTCSYTLLSGRPSGGAQFGGVRQV